MGIDVGGTFTDIAVYDPVTGSTHEFKVPSTTGDMARAVLTALERLIQAGQPIGEVVHGSTIATNAVLERKGASCALVTTRGFRDVLEIGRQYRFNVYDLEDFGRPPPLIERDLRFEITERVDVDGKVVVPLDLDELPDLIATLKARRIQAVAISLLHSYRRPDHEQQLKKALEAHLSYVSASSDVNAEFREYERTSTVVLNAYTMPKVNEYLAHLGAALERLGLEQRFHLVSSNGGMMSASAARQRPVSMVMSGPAAGIAASRFILRALNIRDAVTFDMGGTSTDVCLIHQGEAAISVERKLAGHPVRVSSVEVESIGAGGGSLAWVDAAGALKVGPESAGAEPGPACYGLGGTEATVTDANLVLGYLGPSGTWGDRILVQRSLAEAVVGRLAQRFGLGLEEMAEGIVEIANSSMIGALRLVSIRKGHDLRNFALVAYGGAGPVHAARLAALLQIPRVVVPILSGVFSAFGGLVSDVRYDAVRTVLAPLGQLDLDELEGLFRELEAGCAAPLLAEGYAASSIRLARSMDLRYIGQKYELEVPVDRNPRLDRRDTSCRFDDQHRMVYNYATGEPLECVNVRVSASIETAKPTLAERTVSSAPPLRGERPAFFRETGTLSLPVYSREALPLDWSAKGPLAIEDAWSTTLVSPGQRVAADKYGNLFIEP